jgi:hypothetical protein
MYTQCLILKYFQLFFKNYLGLKPFLCFKDTPTQVSPFVMGKASAVEND